jgi:hypothetical protein
MVEDVNTEKMACLPSSNGLCFLIRSHQPRITRHIGGENCRKPAGGSPISGVE